MVFDTGSGLHSLIIQFYSAFSEKIEAFCKKQAARYNVYPSDYVIGVIKLYSALLLLYGSLDFGSFIASGTERTIRKTGKIYGDIATFVERNQAVAEQQAENLDVSIEKTESRMPLRRVSSGSFASMVPVYSR